MTEAATGWSWPGCPQPSRPPSRSSWEPALTSPTQTKPTSAAGAAAGQASPAAANQGGCAGDEGQSQCRRRLPQPMGNGGDHRGRAWARRQQDGCPARAVGCLGEAMARAGRQEASGSLAWGRKPGRHEQPAPAGPRHLTSPRHREVTKRAPVRYW